MDSSGLKVFGCPKYYHVNDGKLEPRTKKGVFMGYGDGVKGYLILRERSMWVSFMEVIESVRLSGIRIPIMQRIWMLEGR